MVLFAIGFMMLAFVQDAWTFYISFMLIAIGASLSSFLSLVVAVVNWFRRRRSFALGMLSMGFAIGGFAATPMALVIESIGWRTAAFASSVVVLVIGLPLARAIRHRPEDHGLLPTARARTPSSQTTPTRRKSGAWVRPTRCARRRSG